MKTEKSARIGLLAAMVVFSTIGIFRRLIPLPSELIALVRGFTGGLFLIPFALRTEKEGRQSLTRRNLLLLFVSGALLGINWILIFEAYNRTSLAVATLCYYMAPVIVILLSPLFFKEKLTAKKGLCCLGAVIGMVLVSGVVTGGISGDMSGALFALSAAVLYGGCTMMNKLIKGVPPYTKTMMQLFSAGIVLLPFNWATGKLPLLSAVGIKEVLLLLVAGVLYTGIVYLLYFGSIEKLPMQTVAILSYTEPILAVVFSALLLSEPMGIIEAVGAVLVLGCTIASEVEFQKKK